jgi:hypothetical protein
MIMEHGGIEVIRKPESLGYVMQLEQTPDSLKKFSLV